MFSKIIKDENSIYIKPCQKDGVHNIEIVTNRNLNNLPSPFIMETHQDTFYSYLDNIEVFELGKKIVLNIMSVSHDKEGFFPNPKYKYKWILEHDKNHSIYFLKADNYDFALQFEVDVMVEDQCF